MIRSGLKTQKPNDVKYCFVTIYQWCAHVKPYRRISELWEKHGDDHQALIATFQRSWRQRLEFDGQPRSACHIRNLFDD